MKIKKLLGTFLLSNVAIASLLSTNVPSMAASVSVNHHTSSTILLAEINTKYVKDADKNLDSALEAMNNASKAKSDADAAHYFDIAMEHFKNAATALKQAGMLDAAKKLENAIQALNDAIETDSEKQQDKLIKQATDALNQVDDAVKKALT